MPVRISGYKPYKNTAGKINPGCIPFDSELLTELMNIKNGVYSDIIDQCRIIQDHAERNLFKAQHLPSLTISAICKEWRKESNVISHTGYLTFDIDQDHNPSVTDWPKLRDEIFRSEKVVTAFLSASGKGLAFIVRIIPSHHKDVFHSIEYEFKKLLNIVVDKSGKDIVRLRFVSHDPGLKVKPDIEQVPITLPSEEYLKIKKNGGNMIIKYSSQANSVQTFMHAVNFASGKLDFADGSKHWHLVHLAGYCNSVGMDKEFCINMAIKYYSDKTSIPDDNIKTPIESVYKSYKNQHASMPLPPPPYTFKQLRWLMQRICKSLLKKYIYQFGADSFIGERPHSIQVSSKLLAFTMWIIAPEYTWTTKDADEVFTNDECKDTIPSNAYLDTCNNSRVWCCKENNYPLTWNI